MRARNGASTFATAALRRSRSAVIEYELRADAVRVKVMNDAPDSPSLECRAGERGRDDHAERRTSVLRGSVEHLVAHEVACRPLPLPQPHGAVHEHSPR